MSKMIINCWLFIHVKSLFDYWLGLKVMLLMKWLYIKGYGKTFGGDINCLRT